MKSKAGLTPVVVLAIGFGFSTTLRARPVPTEPPPTVHPIAMLPFEERGSAATRYGKKMHDVPFAPLAISRGSRS